MSAPKILYVESDRSRIDGTLESLRSDHPVLLADCGGNAMPILVADPDVAVLIAEIAPADPACGALLGRVRAERPDVVTLVLSDPADQADAIAAVNRGDAFRFVLRPFHDDELSTAVAAAIEYHRLRTAERVLLEDTLRGSLDALTELVALTSPAVFGRMSRVRARVHEISATLGVVAGWQLEVAALLSQVGHVVLPVATTEKLHASQRLSDEEAVQVARVPGVISQLISAVPRLETVREILSRIARESRPTSSAHPALVEHGAAILQIAIDLDRLEGEGRTRREAVAVLRERVGRYDDEILAKLARKREEPKPAREVSVAALHPGMVLGQDARLRDGTLVISRGAPVTATVLEKVRALGEGALREPIYLVAHPPV